MALGLKLINRFAQLSFSLGAAKFQAIGLCRLLFFVPRFGFARLFKVDDFGQLECLAIPNGSVQSLQKQMKRTKDVVQMAVISALGDIERR